MPLARKTLICLIAAGSVCAIRATAQAANPGPNVSEIVALMEQHNQQRAESLKKYRSVRFYHVEFSGLGGHREAQMQSRRPSSRLTGKASRSPRKADRSCSWGAYCTGS
jgi:hypothetical protein